MNRNLGVLAAGAALTGLALAGCSSSSTGDPATTQSPALQDAVSAAPAAFIAQAAETTSSTGSAKITSTTTVTGLEGKGSVPIRADGVVNFSDNEAALRVSSSLFGAGSDIQVILADGKSYVQVPMFGQQWIEMPMTDLGVNVADPAQGLDMLKQMADLKEAGQEPVDGVAATKYTGTVDLREAIGQAGLPTDAQKELDKVSGTADVTVWVDGEGRIIRYDQSARIEVGTGKAVQTTSSTTMTDFGVATDIAPPPADQILNQEGLKELGDLAQSAQ